MATVVQKYGGSSLADADKIKRVAERIAASRQTGCQVVAVCSAMGDTTDDLIKLAHQITPRPDPREMDLLLSTGEVVSSALVAMALNSMGHQAVSLTGVQAGIQTTTLFGKAQITGIEPKRIRKELAEGKTVIVAGFQGFTEENDVTTLGRGASDLTAVALAAALKADRCEIYTDVEGIYTADPRVVPEAVKIPDISYEEMLELAMLGAKMQPRSIELAAIYEVPVLVAHSFKDSPGTLIHREAPMETRNKVRGVACDLNVGKITVLGVPDRPGIAAAIFEPLAQAGVSVDVIVQNASVEKLTDVSFTISRTDLPRAVELVRSIAHAIGAKGTTSSSGLAKVSIVGAGIQNAPGYAARTFRALADAGVNIEMITTSEIRITCIVAEEKAKEAVRILHRAFGLESGS
ncbi:MAG: aspartate kinase [Chloroflexi bacterium]|nr:aspartate kinase [Chloroflexota bacterium]